jgi:hypothetical protein
VDDIALTLHYFLISKGSLEIVSSPVGLGIYDGKTKLLTVTVLYKL